MLGKKKISRGICYAVTGSVFWGASGTVAQSFFTNETVSPLSLVGIRLLVAGVLLLLWYRFTSQQSLFLIWQRPSDRKILTLFALLGMLPSQLSYFMAIQAGNAATATVLQFLGPIFIILYLLGRNRIWPSQIDLFSVLLALVGTFLLVTNGQFGQLTLSFSALFWGLAAGLSQASYTLLPRQLLKNFDGRLVVGWAMTLAGLLFLPLLVVSPQPRLSWLGFGQIAFIIIFGTMLSYLFYIKSLQDLEPATTGLLSSFEPLTATILAVTVLGTPLAFFQGLGGCLILAIVFVQAGTARK